MLPNLCSRYCHQPRRPLFALSRASEHHRSFCRAPAQPYTPALPLARADSARWIDTMGNSEACRWWRGGLSSPAPGPVGRVACGASRWRAQQRFRRSRLGLLEYWRGRALAAPRGVLCVRAKCTKGVVVRSGSWRSIRRMLGLSLRLGRGIVVVRHGSHAG